MKNLLYIAALLFLASCGGNKPKDKKAELAELQKQQAELNAKIAKLQAEIGTNDSGKVLDVTVYKVETGQFSNYVEIQGKIDAEENVTAFPQAAGVITAIYVKPGQRVSKGQKLVQLDNSVLVQQIGQAEAQVTLARSLYQRQKNLWDQKIGTEVQFLQAQTNLQSTEKQLSALRQQSALYSIKSPINGTIEQMDLKLGESVSPGLSGIGIVNDKNLKVKANVPESYASSVSTGNKVKILIPDANDSVTTSVTFAGKAIDPVSRSFPIEVKLPSRNTLRPNMTAVLKIADYTKANAIAVPVKAIQKSENGDYVYVNQNGVAKQKNVKQGNVSGGRAEIVSGLQTGDLVIVEGAADLEDGDKVKVLQGI
ncbi:efflux RND transporter periplasmic adaptor subunit [Mucilaginibacter limnophilus]|uniref:Efflux RND transporter periplasmic adaptor subunit n=1 Tax=Mucilaginibacter limnophilus TaxID=1932778 RepID=A0A3S2Y0G8_9SPHI|nr:efflux RND transporter periplasmic adaptor subunit [Mucilaginibacter limnophilus]RVU00577.1 efflux RND transporter periplasmic adaptor subunit [Mucilaginibacter limnophilus]